MKAIAFTLLSVGAPPLCAALGTWYTYHNWNTPLLLLCDAFFIRVRQYSHIMWGKNMVLSDICTNYMLGRGKQFLIRGFSCTVKPVYNDIRLITTWSQYPEFLQWNFPLKKPAHNESGLTSGFTIPDDEFSIENYLSITIYALCR